MKINENGFWENPNREGHAHDSRLAGAILKILKSRKIDTLVDFGCGTGEYARFFKRHGIDVEAYDGQLMVIDSKHNYALLKYGRLIRKNN